MLEPQSERVVSTRPLPNPPDVAWLFQLIPSSLDLPHASDKQTIEDGRRILGVGPVAWAVEIACDVAAHVGEQEPGLAAGESGPAVLRQGIEATIIQMMVALVPGSSPEQSGAGEEALVGDRLWARRGIPLDRVLRAIRIGHSAVADHLLRAVEHSKFVSDRDARSEEMSRVSRILFGFIDGFASSMAAEYQAELRRWVGGTDARRLTMVEDLLSGRCSDAPRASRLLGYDLGREHIAAILRVDAAGSGRSVDLARLGHRIAEDRPSLLVTPDPAVAWLWTTGEPEVEQSSLPPGVRVSIGLPLPELDGFRDSHLQACHADRIATLSGSSVTRYAEVETAALATSDTALARRFVRTELGALAAPEEDVLRETVRSYLETAGSINQAARALFVSKNTVTYRIRKAERLLGRTVHDRSFELLLALRIVNRLGPTFDPSSHRAPVDGPSGAPS